MRAGSFSTPKQYQEIEGQALLAYSVKAFLATQQFSTIVLVTAETQQEMCKRALGEWAQYIHLQVGGPTRQASTLAGLEFLESFSPDYVHIHDAARALIKPLQLKKLNANLSPKEGQILAIPIIDSLKKSDQNNYICANIERENTYQAQTPQVFPFSAMLDAHRKAAQQKQQSFTDDAALALWAGLPVKIIEGQKENFKITWPEDFSLAAHYLKTEKEGQMCFPDIRTGTGYDVHRFTKGSKVILCGVSIPFDKSLEGHSDADVGLHALTDALLATCGAGDIGTHFPPTEKKWQGVSSDVFLRYAADYLAQKKARITLVDITFIAEKPYIGAYRTAMKEHLQKLLGLESERISIKATTNEKMGFIGREEGIAAFASATVLFPTLL